MENDLSYLQLFVENDLSYLQLFVENDLSAAFPTVPSEPWLHALKLNISTGKQFWMDYLICKLLQLLVCTSSSTGR